MKLTDFALIFIAIFLPVVIIVYVNTSFVVKAEKQEMYYKNMINSAVTDAVSSMKQIENEDEEIDYGYSGIVDRKVSINAKTAISTFYSSLANNFGIANNENSINRLKMYIPVVAILDYDGIYIHSAEEQESGDISFVTKPKVNYTYTYVITETLTGGENFNIQAVEDVDDLLLIKNKLLSKYIYEVNFTMDDYIYLNIYEFDTEQARSKIGKIVYSKNFYLNDNINNKELVYEANELLSSRKTALRKQVVEHLNNMRLQYIAEIGMKEISYAVNKHNSYAEDTGINYTFRFSVESDQAWYETMDGIGMIAIVQGISLGNRYLNYKAYSAADLTMTKKYYVTKGVTGDTIEENERLAYFTKDLYHASNKCRVYLEFINSTSEQIVPNSYTSKAEAATQGYYPCPICKP